MHISKHNFRYFSKFMSMFWDILVYFLSSWKSINISLSFFKYCCTCCLCLCCPAKRGLVKLACLLDVFKYLKCLFDYNCYYIYIHIYIYNSSRSWGRRAAASAGQTPVMREGRCSLCAAPSESASRSRAPTEIAHHRARRDARVTGESGGRRCADAGMRAREALVSTFSRILPEMSVPISEWWWW